MLFSLCSKCIFCHNGFWRYHARLEEMQQFDKTLTAQESGPSSSYSNLTEGFDIIPTVIAT